MYEVRPKKELTIKKYDIYSVEYFVKTGRMVTALYTIKEDCWSHI